MSLKFTISTILSLFCLAINAQETLPTAYCSEPINIEYENLKRGIYIHCNSIDTQGIVNVLMINNSRNSIILNGFNQRLDFNIQAKINGAWKDKSFNITCATGYGQFNLPAHTYTWQKVNISDYIGTYETNIRFYTHADDSIIISKNIKIAVDTTFFLSEDEMRLNKLNELLKVESGLSKKERLTVMTMKANVLASLNRTDEAIKAFDTLLEQYPTHYKAYYEYGLFLLKHVSTIEKANKIARKAHLRKALSLFEVIPRSSEYYKKAKRFRETISKELIDTRK